MEKGTKLFVAVYILMILTLVVIADLGLGKPFYELAKAVPGSDKTGHFLLMGFISFPVHLLLKNPLKRVWNIPIPSAAVFIIPIILLEELSQFFFDNRNCSTLDFACDVAGVFSFGYQAVIYKFKTFKLLKIC